MLVVFELIQTPGTVFCKWRLYLNTMKVGNKRGRIFNKEGEMFESVMYSRTREWSEKTIGT